MTIYRYGGMNPSDAQNQAAKGGRSDQQTSRTEGEGSLPPGVIATSRDTRYPIGVGMGPPPPPESGPGGRDSTPDATTAPMYGASDGGRTPHAGPYGPTDSSLPETNPDGASDESID